MHANADQENLPPLIQALCNPAAWPHAVESVRVIETHISWILLTGEYAYKIKQPLDLGFLDFRTLEQRRAACYEELWLNRRNAPELYRCVVAICGSKGQLVIRELADDAPADDSALEYAVCMREFPQDQQLDWQLHNGDLQIDDMDELAETVAEMHARAPVASASDEWGTVDLIAKPALDNCDVLEPLMDDADDRSTLRRLRDWTATQLALLAPRMLQRRHDGFIRECHGDLHLSNIARFEGKFVPFDCIEFDPALRWRDTMSEVAFVAMDLASRLRIDMAWRFLNRYLEISGDYGGASLLRFYMVYNALVRAKVAAIRAEQYSPRSAIYQIAARHYRMHLSLAERATRQRFPVVILTTGTSGSGKTWLTDRLCSVLPAIRIRSDIERKRLHGLGATAKTDAGISEGIYSEAATGLTYKHLRDRTSDMLAADFDVIVDATFLKHEHRALFLELARDTRSSLVILQCHADQQVLEDRIQQRESDGSDASESDRAVLAHQKAVAEPLTTAEQALAVSVDTSEHTDPLRVAGAIWRKLGREIVD